MPKLIPSTRFVHMLSVFLKERMMKSFSATYFSLFRLFDLSALINLAFLFFLCNAVCALYWLFVCMCVCVYALACIFQCSTNNISSVLVYHILSLWTFDSIKEHWACQLSSLVCCCGTSWSSICQTFLQYLWDFGREHDKGVSSTFLQVMLCFYLHLMLKS